jgi:predicted nucleic acid-binding protein
MVLPVYPNGIVAPAYEPQGDGRSAPHAEPGRLWPSFHRNGRVQYLDEPPEVTAAFRSLTPRNLRGNNSWSDAYIAAVAQRSGLTVATFDRGFIALGVEALIVG